jgi:hypothetical protein
MSPEVSIAVARLRSAWDAGIGLSRRRALVAVVATVLVGAAHLARIGSPAARAVAGAALVLLAAAWVVWALVQRRRRRDVRYAVRSVVGPIDAALASATLRAMTLVDRMEVDPKMGSLALAELHVSRLVGRVSIARVRARAAKVGARWSAAGLGLAAVALVVIVVEPFRVVEGLDVLAARRGRAPLPLAWLDDVELDAAPPAYLHARDARLAPFAPTAQPRGTTLTVRGRPLHAGRALVLTDGVTEAPFVGDGQSGVVARFVLGDSTELFVAARFGSVLVPEPDTQAVTSIADEAPKVLLDGAPRTVRLLDEPSIALRYEATDDHGLREVHLVLRAGTREERRVLSRPEAEAKSDRGAVELRSTDRFLRRMFVPVVVTIEARDNDGVLGPKWGKSEAIVVVPPELGEAEAQRIAALVAARDQVTDLLADRLFQSAPEVPTRTAHVAHEKEAQEKAVLAVHAALAQEYGGLRVDGRVASLFRGQLRRLGKALDAEAARPSASTHEALVVATESTLLALDAGLRALGVRDTRAVAKRVADVADDAASAGDVLATATEPAPAPVAKLDAAVEILRGGGRQLLRLGDLGADLGEIVVNDLRRIDRAREAGQLAQAALAARDLAARLRHPHPSFSGGSGSGSGSGGTESGAGQGEGEASEVDQEQAEIERELEDLVREHAGAMNEVAEALERAASSEDLQALRDQAREHAEAIREAVKRLPSDAGAPGTAESAGAAGRQRAEAMAGALERGQASEAVESGQGALRELDRAKRLGDEGRGSLADERAGREAGLARDTIERELAFAERALAELRQRAGAGAREALGRASEAEKKLADRTRKLADKGERGDAALPEDLLGHLSDAEQAMRGAGEALAAGDGARGHEKQDEAQRLLEMARGEPSPSSDGTGREQSPDGAIHPTRQPIPGKGDHKGPEAFRRRVLEGLGGDADPLLREAVKRYAEGLLR